MNDFERRRKEKAKLDYEALMKFYPFELEDLPDELWKAVPNWQGYQVSNFGRVKSFRNDKPQILKPKVSLDYLQVELFKDGKGKKFQVHRLVAQAFIPNPLNKPQVNHLDGVKFNNHVSNLDWTTAKENTRHAVDTGLVKQGEDRHDTKLTNQQVQYIRDNPLGLNTYELADLFGVNRRTISDIQRGYKYKTVGGVIREKLKGGLPRVPDNIRNQIRAEYVYGSHEFGSRALARKYGISQTTVLEIVRQT